MILDRMHYVPIGWWRWSKVRFIIFSYRLRGGLKKHLGLNQHFQLMNPLYSEVRFKPTLLSSFKVDELEMAKKICPVNAINGNGKQWKVDIVRCNSCHLCFKVAPHSLKLVSIEGEEIVTYGNQEN